MTIDLSTCNDEQREAILSNDSHILCLAAAGSGKTFTMITRIARLVSEGVKPDSILALTFTNAAAFEMAQRYKKMMGSSNSSISPEFRTFHGFCYNLIIKDRNIRERLGYEKVPQVCEDSDYKKLKKELVIRLGLTLTDKELEGEVFGKEKQRQMELFNKALKKELRTQNLITFDMMCYNVGQLFQDDAPEVHYYKHKYKYIMLDESQDTDPRQMKFISSFGDNINYFFVGDILQNIYSFRGCTNEVIKVLAKAPDWTVIKLYQNYRSTRQICEFANRFSVYADKTFRIPMNGQRDGEEVTVIRGACAGYNQSVDPRHLRSLVKMLRENPSQCAIICRSNREVNAVAEKLKEEDIDFSRSRKESDAIFILNSVLDNEYMKDWLSTLLEGPRYADYIRLSSQEKNPDIRWFLSLYGNEAKIKEPFNKIVKIRKIVSDESATVQSKLEQIKKILKVKASKEFDIPEDSKGKQLIEELRDAMLVDEETKIYIGTIHSVKGLEYDTVYVMGVDDKSFQLGDEEMNNLYYVAITRPKEKLVVFRK